MPYSALAAELAELDARGLRRHRRVLHTPQGARVTVDGREYVSFCSNDYLGLAGDPILVAAAQEGAARYGVGSGASHLLTGHSIAHAKLEQALAAFVGMPGAALFSTGYMANIGVVTALLARDDAVFADRLNHASLNDAALLSRAAFKRYRHADMRALEQALAQSRARRKLVVTDAVFSMDGDIAPVPELAALCERYDAWLLIDDAHGFGVLGPEGRGTAAMLGLRSPHLVYMATLGKAAGVAGAFVAGEASTVEWIMQRARSYIFATAAPALIAEALRASVKVIAEESWRRQHLQALITRLREDCAQALPAGWRLVPSDTPIQPIVIGDNATTLAAMAALWQQGLWVPAIRPPTVPEGTARLRVSLSAAHSLDDVDKLVRALAELTG